MLRLSAAAAAGIMVILAVVAVVWVPAGPAPSELGYTLVSDEDGNVGVGAATGSFRLVNKCSLYGCHTVRVRVTEDRKLEAEHEARLRAIKAQQNSKLLAQRDAMEVALKEREAGVRLGTMYKQQELAAAPQAEQAAATIAEAFAKVDSENPEQKAAVTAEVSAKAAQEAAAQAAAREAKKASRKPKDSLQAEAKQAIVDSAAVKQTVQAEVAAIRVAAKAAESKIEKEEHDEVNELKAADRKEKVRSAPVAPNVRSAPVVAPLSTTSKKVALPLQDGPKAAKFSKPQHVAAEKEAKPAHASAPKVAPKTEAEPVVKRAAVPSKTEEKQLPRADRAARAPKTPDMMDGDQKPRGEAPAAVDAGYWQPSLPAATAKPGGGNPGAAWGRRRHKSLKVAAGSGIKLSQLPPKSGGYVGRRAEGRAVMRAPGAAVEPDFADRTVVVNKAPRQVFLPSAFPWAGVEG